ncbi:MAG: class I tRNA ligase family protein [Puniceicoccales bacterium]|jgi:methionyl-tRNA synthetase|nr:class I tRNA ligase family protein [Puniceicoccales bacterium]
MVPESPENEIVDLWSKTRNKVLEAYDRLQFHSALEDIFAFIGAINKFLEIRAPWKLAKSDLPEDQKRLCTALAVCSEAIRLTATILMPILPTVSQQILEIFQIKTVFWKNHLDWNGECLVNQSLAVKSIILFPRIV